MDLIRYPALSLPLFLPLKTSLCLLQLQFGILYIHLQGYMYHKARHCCCTWEELLHCVRGCCVRGGVPACVPCTLVSTAGRGQKNNCCSSPVKNLRREKLTVVVRWITTSRYSFDWLAAVVVVIVVVLAEWRSDGIILVIPVILVWLFWVQENELPCMYVCAYRKQNRVPPPF